jgi:hypothetical protein
MPVGLLNHRWTNPGWIHEETDFVYGCDGRQINLASTYPTKPQGAMGSGSQSDSVWAANWDSSKGVQNNGGSPGMLRLPGGNYANGSAPARDFYVRFQVYWTSNYTWPGDPRNDKYAFGASPCIDNKIIFIGPSEWGLNPTNASYDAGALTSCAVWDPVSNARYSDALIFRVGTASDNYKTFPMCTQCASNNQHTEYAPYQHPTAFRNPNDTPTFGKIFRFNTNRWYTIEFHYVLSTSGSKNGTIEAWVDGTKIYSASDLATCESVPGNGDCSGVGYVWLGAYHNSSDVTNWSGQQIIDNLIISRSYIGPPGVGAPNPTPSAPTNSQLR